MPTHLRPARADDLPALQAIARRTITASYTPFLGQEVVAAFLDSGASDAYLADHLGLLVVLVADGAPRGFTVGRDDCVELMMVDAAHHRKGWGSLLLRHVEQQLFRAHDEIWLESFAPNERANRFYRKHGWQAGESTFDPESGVHKIRFTKRLEASPSA